MITIEIPKKELLRQLPQKAGYALIEWLEDMPETFVFDGVAHQTPENILAGKYPHLAESCTRTEWRLFCALYERGRVTQKLLANLLKLTGDKNLEPMSNIINVHVKNLRRKLVSEPFKILTVRSNNHENNGSYEIVAL